MGPKDAVLAVVAGALAETVPTFTGPVPLRWTVALGQKNAEEQVPAVAVTLVAFRTVAEPLMKTCADAPGLVVVEWAVKLDAESTAVAKIVPFVATSPTVPVLLITPALTLVPERETLPAPEATLPVFTDEFAAVSDTFPPPVAMAPVETPNGAVAVKAPPVVVTLDVEIPLEVEVSEIAPVPEVIAPVCRKF